MKKRGLIKKLLLLVLPMLVLVVSVLMVINFSSTKRIMTESTYEKLTKESNYNVKVIASWKESLISALDSVKNALESVTFNSEEQELNYLESVTKQMMNQIPNGMYAAAADGTYLDGSGWIPDADYIPTERDWYLLGLENEGFEFGAPYMDANTKSFIVSAASRIDRNDRKDMLS